MTEPPDRATRRQDAGNLPAKLTRPVLRGWQPPERLMALVAAMPEPCLVWICGPAGAGKTTVAAALCERSGQGSFWYRITEDDRNPGILHANLRQFLARESEHLLPDEHDARQLLACLCRTGTPSVTLVFDGLDRLPEPEPLLRLFRDGLEHLPAACRLLVTAREPPPPSLAALSCTGKLRVIDWQALKLDTDACSAAIRTRGLDESRELAEWLCQVTEGWAAGVSLILDTLATTAVDHLEFTSDFVSMARFDAFFEHEVLNSLPDRTQALLFRVALLPEFTAGMAGALAEERDAANILDTLSGRQLFLEKRNNQGSTIYRLHSLFRTSLQRLSEKRFPEQWIHHWKLRAAAVLEESGRIGEAAKLYLETQNWQTLAQLIEKHGPELANAGRHAELAAWLAAIPAESLERDAALCFWEGTCLLAAGEAAKAATRFEQAFTMADGECEELALSSLHAAIEAILHDARDLQRLDTWLSRLTDRDHPNAMGTIPALWPTASANLLIAMTFRQPDHPALPLCRKQVETRLENAGRGLEDAIAAHALIVHRLWSGYVHDAQPVVDRLSDIANAAPLDNPQAALATIFLHIGRAAHECLDGRSTDCVATVERGLKISSSVGIPIWDNHLRGFAAAACLSTGAGKGAARWLRVLKRHLDFRRQFDVALFRMLQVWHTLDHGPGPARALPHAEAGLAAAETLGASIPLFCAHLQLASVLNGLDEADAASRHLARAESLAEQWRNPLLVFMAGLERAAMALREKDNRGLETALRRTLALGRRHDYTGTWFWRPAVMGELCAAALQRGVETDYVCSLIRRRDLPAPLDNPEPGDWPWPVRIHTLGRFGIQVHGAPLETGRKTPHVPLNLLRILIALGGRGVSREHLLDLLWPDTDGDAAARNLSVTLSRLRSLLRCEAAIVVRDSCLSLDPRYCWVDVWAFERALGSVTDTLPLSAERALEAIARYQGPFLADTEAAWAIEMRERLAQRFAMAIHQWGRELERNGDWAGAERLYRHGITALPLDDSCHQRLVEALLQQGHLGQAVDAVNRCRQLFTAHGIPEPPWLQQLQRRITGLNP